MLRKVSLLAAVLMVLTPTVSFADDKKSSAASEFKFAADDPYMLSVRRRIKRAWFPPKTPEGKVVIASFRLLRDGSTTDLKLVKPCQLRLADEAALAAIKNASPFRPFPKHAPNSVRIEFRFPEDTFLPHQ